MIRAKTITCSICQNHYSDPRQIPCSHSFCFDCIEGRFDEVTLSLTCPECKRTHQYKSIEEFQNRCMRNAVLATMVAQFKKNQSRSSNPSSRPSSTISHSSPTFSSTPIPTQFSSTMTNGFYSDPTTSERSSPAVTISTGRPSPVASTTNTYVLIAKCQSCNVRSELIVCSHCESVICEKCAVEHQQQTKITDDVQREWELCKAKFDGIQEKSMRFDHDREEMEKHAHSLQKIIYDKAKEMIQTVESQKRTYLEQMDQSRENRELFAAHKQIHDEFESIDKRVTDWLRSNEMSAEKNNEFLSEIDHLENRLDELSHLLNSNQSFLQFPVLSVPEEIDVSSLFGSLEFLSSKNPIARSNPYASTVKVEETTTTTTTTTTNHQKNYWSVELESEQEDEEEEEEESEPIRTRYSHPMNSSIKTETNPSPAAAPSIPKKKILWSIDYFSVPYYVRTYGNQLFVCDRYGSLAIYRFNKSNDMRQKPERILQTRLFKDNSSSSNNDDDQTIIDSFVVYKLWIIVFKRKKNELIGTIHLFTHDGRAVPNGKCFHNYPSRELTMDTEKNLLWSLDQKQLTLFCYDLPDSKVNNPNEYFQDRRAHVQLTKPFAPIHISVNRNVLAVLDKNRGAVHVFDKESKRQLYEYVNFHHRETHGCWDMALFSDNSLLIKLDETSTLKAGPSKHIYLQLDNTPQHNIIGLIDETDAYGMMITPNDEILIGVRITTKGIVKCYV